MATLTTSAPAQLSKEEILRYSRHLIMPEVGMDGQLKLKQAKVLCIGAGGQGSPLALYLAAAGVGRLGIVDFDVVDFTNLQRQIIHDTSDVGRLKIESAKDTIADINPNVEVVAHETRLTSENALDIFRDYDIVADGTDNFPTRYLVNDACVLLGKPNVYGSIFRFEGQATVFYAKEGPCYRCLYPEPPPPGMVPSCAEGGVLGVLPEFQICRIPGSTLIPLGDVPKRMHELSSADEIVVHCRSGMRSAQAVELLMKAGFRKIHNLKGGVLAWADQVDPTMPKY